MKPHILNSIFLHEFKVLFRNNVLKTLSIIIAVMLITSIWSGSSMLATQNDTTQKIESHEREMADSLKTRINRVEKNQMVYPGFIWDDPTYAYNTARNEGPKYAVKNPFILQALCIGQSDIQPFYYKVYINKKQYLTYDQEIRNSFLQFIGNFDFSFVVIFLMPLLIIIFSYNVLSFEKEQGTWVLLKTSNQSIPKLIFTKLLIRYLLFTTFFWILVAIVLTIFTGASAFATSNWWMLFISVSIYFAFWFSVCFFVNSFSFSSNINALLLILIWLLTSIILPDVLQITLDKKYPIPSRVELQTEERNAINNYFESDGQSLTKEVFSSPRTMIRQASIVTPGMVYGYGVIVLKSQLIKDSATQKAEARLYGQIEKQQAAISKWQLISPALMMQETLSGLSGTHWHQFNQFSKDVDTFRTATQNFYYPKMLYENTYRTFSQKDADAIPTFNKKKYYGYDWLHLPSTFISYIFIMLAMVVAGYIKMHHSERY